MKLFNKEPMKVSIRGALYNVDKRQYKRGVTQATIYKDEYGFIIWSTVHGSGKVYCELNISQDSCFSFDTELPDTDYVANPRYRGYYIVGDVLSEDEAFELIADCTISEESVWLM